MEISTLSERTPVIHFILFRFNLQYTYNPVTASWSHRNGFQLPQSSLEEISYKSGKMQNIGHKKDTLLSRGEKILPVSCHASPLALFRYFILWPTIRILFAMLNYLLLMLFVEHWLPLTTLWILHWMCLKDTNKWFGSLYHWILLWWWSNRRKLVRRSCANSIPFHLFLMTPK